MTLLVAWAGVDSRSPSSVYIATDSRVSWGAAGHFDQANKTFSLNGFPAIFGYCGDSLVSQMLISQTLAVIEAISGFKDRSLNELVDIFIRLIIRNYTAYPTKFSSGSFTVVICGKATLEASGEFECYRVDSNFKETKKEQISLPKQSGPIVVTGSGANDFNSQYKNHQLPENPNKSTSRDVFHAFYQTIMRAQNPTVGRIPQITSVYRKPNTGGTHCGVIVNGKRYISGLLIDKDIAPEDIKWFNDNFEITNSQTKQKEYHAQAQPPFRC